MERTKKVTKEVVEDIGILEEPTLRWKKTGGGTFRMPNRIIKPNEVFEAKPSEIPMGFRHIIIPLDEIPAEALAPKVIGKTMEYSIVKREKGSWYDVVTEGGKKLNEKALTKDDAEKMVEDLLK